MIQARGVKRAFPVSGGTFLALKGIDVDIPAGALTILKGRSGSGKTTLLNILGALDKPTSGKVLLGGKNISKMDERRRAKLRRRDIGFVFQSVALVPMMSAQENIEFALRLARYKGNRTERALECLKMVGLDKRANHMPQELSGGEQQRVAIARAIAHKPKVIFADEPTGELDTNTGLRVVKIFKDLIEKEGVTIVMTTHDTGLMEIGDRVYEILDGEVAGDDDE
ncbi:MAG: ABC transporter ATP-binding protein [Clostridia bacterium]|nr:ABC transporter ATP-binding protein [Clostridia bacterium]MBQ2433224.1 ABC transporter ATP-binding protein [Clostridia bacterium]MBQ5770643.1 ABC transporter ATP-binding protein [Clostridia bacterium]